LLSLFRDYRTLKRILAVFELREYYNCHDARSPYFFFASISGGSHNGDNETIKAIVLLSSSYKLVTKRGITSDRRPSCITEISTALPPLPHPHRSTDVLQQTGKIASKRVLSNFRQDMHMTKRYEINKQTVLLHC
jgi:hypothetical protein